MDVKKEKQPAIGTQGPMKKQAGLAMTQEHSQQQADMYEVLLKLVKIVRANTV